LQRRTAKATDLLIIATAAATGRTLYTLDGAQARLAQARRSRHEDALIRRRLEPPLD
jgi:predicted nucleic acid-binding protein